MIEKFKEKIREELENQIKEELRKELKHFITKVNKTIAEVEERNELYINDFRRRCQKMDDAYETVNQRNDKHTKVVEGWLKEIKDFMINGR